MMLVQLPDSMPGLMAMEGDRAPRTKVKAEPKVHQTMSTEADLSEKLSSKCRLSDLSEGKIGKLQVLSSGKMRLVLGDIMFDVSRGAPCGFLQVRSHAVNHRLSMYRSQIDLSEIDPWKDVKDRSQSF